MKNFVQLHRTFSPVSDLAPHSPSEWDEDLFGAFATQEQRNWEQLLRHQAVVILGEAGTGKTREFDAQVRKLRSEEKSAFFFPLDALVQETLEEALVPEELARLRAWQDGSEEGFFFLDSVDESRLQASNAFEKALRHWRRGIGNTSLDRIHVMVSCRVSDWRPQQDLEALRHALQLSRQFHIPVMQLTPLDDEQRHKLLGACGIEDVRAILEAIQRTQASRFAERPQDVLWLAEHWRRTGQLGSLTDLLEANVTQKLDEHNPQHAHGGRLSSERAWQGAAALAFAATVCKCPAIRLPGSDWMARPGTLDPKRIILDWSEPEIRQLLSRSLFDEATYGRVRFHHRDTREYLAAKWIIQHCRELGHDGLKKLFIREVHGQRLVIPSMRGLAGWVMPFDTGLRHQLLDAAPELFWSTGDPQKLPLPEREHSLEHLVTQFREGQRLSTWNIRGRSSLLGLFADPRLVPKLISLLHSKLEAPDIHQLVLEIILTGRLQEGAEDALQVAKDQTRPLGVQRMAIRAAAACGTPAQLGELLRLAREQLVSSNELIAELIDACFPEQLSIPDCFELLRKMPPLDPHHYSRACMLFEEGIPDRCPEQSLPELFAHLLALHQGDRPEFTWVQPALARAFARLIEVWPPGTPPDEQLAEVLFRLQAGYQSRRLTWNKGFNETQETLRTHAQSQSRVLRACIQRDARRTLELFRSSPSLCSPQMEDWSALLDQVLLSEDAAWRRSALSELLVAWEAQQQQSLPQLLEARAKAHPELHEELERRKPPPLSSAEAAWREESRHHYEEELRQRFRGRLEQIASGDDVAGLSDLYLLARTASSGQGKDARYPLTDYARLREWLGVEFAEAARKGWSRFWRGSFLEQYAKGGVDAPDSFLWPGAWNAVLSELKLESAEQLQQLSGADAERVAFWAMAQQQDLPEWFSAFAESHPRSVQQAFAWGVEAELAYTCRSKDNKRRRSPAKFLRHLSIPLGELERLCLPYLLDMLERYEPTYEGDMRRALGALLEAPSRYGPKLAALASARAQRAEETGDEERLALWLAAWLRAEAPAAWSHIEKKLSAQPELAPRLLIRLGWNLGLDWVLQQWQRWTYTEQSDYRQPAVLRSMYRAYREHLHGRQGPWSRTEQLEYQEEQARLFWTSLPDKISRLPGTEAHETLSVMADDPAWVDQRKTFLFLIEQHRLFEAEALAWQPEAAVHFMRHHTVPPTTADEYFESLWQGMLRLKHTLEQGDYSGTVFPAEAKMDERLVQRFLAQHLDHLLKAPLSLTRESELKAGKKPDFLVQLGGLGQVPIEFKPLDKERYPYKALEDILQHQLLQYLHDSSTTHGILLLVRLQFRNWRLEGRTENVSFEEIVQMLSQSAEELHASKVHGRRVYVLGIDLAPVPSSGVPE
jgi:hypothetical protein